jgi:hypothetical protein
MQSTLGRRFTTDFRSDWQVVSRSRRMSAIHLLTVFFNLSNLYNLFLKTFTGLPSSMCLFTRVRGVLSSTSWFIINLFIIIYFVVVSRRPSVPAKTSWESSGCKGLERVNKLPNSLTFKWRWSEKFHVKLCEVEAKKFETLQIKWPINWRISFPQDLNAPNVRGMQKSNIQISVRTWSIENAFCNPIPRYLQEKLLVKVQINSNDNITIMFGIIKKGTSTSLEVCDFYSGVY